MKHRNRISRAQRRTLYAATALLALTGLMWLSVHQLAWPAMSRASMEGLPSPWEPWLMKLHGAAMMVMLFLTGRISATHVMRGWRLKWRVADGVGLLVGLAALTLTGYSLYYLVPDDWRDANGWLHAAIGVLWVVTLLVHRRTPPGRH
ncbi:MAG TPA: hypothetical protein VFW93_00700 [Aquabacterium sp.]|uniref:hypothetical protein n=1 Tax=Aquabacterium sp. TaxID=1872578 RepID=UPI002E35D201|nr:hypothetical protein [Aquabacterium sp.]HEX5354703.1 hypothetical protein [Aquabacterium sp.]